MDNKHRKLFVIKQSKGCKFMPKMHQNTFSGRAPPGPAGGTYAALCATPDLLAAMVRRTFMGDATHARGKRVERGREGRRTEFRAKVKVRRMNSVWFVCVYTEGAVESGGWTVQHLGRTQRPVSTRQVPTAAHRPTRLRTHSHQGPDAPHHVTFQQHTHTHV